MKNTINAQINDIPNWDIYELGEVCVIFFDKEAESSQRLCGVMSIGGFFVLDLE